MAELHPGAKRVVERVLAAPQVMDIPLEEARRGIEDETLDAWGELDEVAEIWDTIVEGVRVRIYHPGLKLRLPAVVFFHGGGWVIGSIESHDPLCRALAARSPAVVISVDYRLAPEHRFPAAADDAWAVLQWVAAHAADLGADSKRLVVAGDSAGGNLAAVVALRARDERLPLALQVLIYPVTDSVLDSSGYIRLGDGLNLTCAKMKWFWDNYLGDGDGAHPQASPLRATDLTGLAPALVQIAEYDPLADEGEAYALRMRDAGVRVSVTRFDGQIHGFIRLPAHCGRQSDDALAEIVSAISQA